MYYNYTEEELRSYCRASLESLELWARRLIHEQMTAAYGDKFYETKIGENYLIKSEVRKHIETMLSSNPSRFSRAVDMLFFEHIIYFLCNQTWYTSLFKPALDYVYPEGYMEVRTFLNRLVPIRNALSHGNPISVHQAEQAVCYSHDFIEGIKQFYKDRGLEQVWNVPRIIRVTDSLGNVFENPTDSHFSQSIFTVKTPFHCCDTYSVNVEIDSSYSNEEYDIKWGARNYDVGKYLNSERFAITFDYKHVSQSYFIECTVTSKKEWHKYNSIYDCKIALQLTVLPPSI